MKMKNKTNVRLPPVSQFLGLMHKGQRLPTRSWAESGSDPGECFFVQRCVSISTEAGKLRRKMHGETFWRAAGVIRKWGPRSEATRGEKLKLFISLSSPVSSIRGDRPVMQVCL